MKKENDATDNARLAIGKRTSQNLYKGRG